MVDNFLDSLSSTPDRELIAQLESACQNLFWFSEAEYPLRVFYWQDLSNCDEYTLLKRHNYPAGTKIAVKKLPDFFDSATKSEPWHNETEQIEVKRYQALVDLIAKNLSDIRVYLLGDIEIDVYVLGKTEHQAIAGLTTKIVQT